MVIVAAATNSERVGLASVLAHVPGKWAAVDRRTNELRLAADNFEELDAEIRRLGLLNEVVVIRAPEPGEPELVGLG